MRPSKIRVLTAIAAVGGLLGAVPASAAVESAGVPVGVDLPDAAETVVAGHAPAVDTPEAPEAPAMPETPEMEAGRPAAPGQVGLDVAAGTPAAGHVIAAVPAPAAAAADAPGLAGLPAAAQSPASVPVPPVSIPTPPAAVPAP